ncbi:MAG: ribosome-associated translation inhibitor RaiA [Pirellulaceae bacterium]|nr:ribosome-associated translation inhibitor RaiA [Pirellulaceae bacterium]
MQINISTRHGHLSSQSQEKITEKVTKLTRFHERLSSTTVTVDLENEERPDVEIQVTAEKAKRFVASSQSENLMGAVESVINKIEQQLKKDKEKRSTHRNQGRRNLETESESEQSI